MKRRKSLSQENIPEKKIQTKRPDSPEPSLVSMKSDRSMGFPPNLSQEAGGGPSLVSMKSVRSMGFPPNLSQEAGGGPSLVSMKSDRSMGFPPNLSQEAGGGPSLVSMKSVRSMGFPPNLSQEAGGGPSLVSMKSDRSMGHCPISSDVPVSSDPQQQFTQAEDLKQDSKQPVDYIKRHKTSMRKYETLFEGIQTQKNRTLLKRIYTQLYIIEGESEGVNEEHEVLQMEKTPRRPMQDTSINLPDIFKPLQCLKERKQEEDIGAGKKIPDLRTVLTKGIAGIGKTVSVQKFVLDWAEGTANQDVDFMFVLSFRELNLIKDDEYSLQELLCVFHPELKDLDSKIYKEHKVVFILDGLDESRNPLEFGDCKKVSDITMTSSVGVLITNLIKGEILPSALIWITSRPAAANQIPPQYIDRVTEIQGFNDPQKEDYFRNRIREQDQAQKIFSHIKKARSLHIMCHIPVFCWMSSSVLQRIMDQDSDTEIPKTLTEMYSHFLITQTNMKNEKYEEKDERDPQKLLKANRSMLLKLGKLAFKQLMEGNVMFYEEDLRESGIDITEASVYSGVFTEIFREECVLYQRKVYCFVHLSFQEFLAAVYVVHCYQNQNMEELQSFKPESETWSQNVPLDELLMGAVYKAVESQNGHLDLFLRFLLGLSLESNQKLLHGLLEHTHSCSEKTNDQIKKIIKRNTYKSYRLTTDRSINLFLCLSEMNDQSLSRETEEFLKSEKHSGKKLSPGQCSALACMLLTSEEVLEELDLKKYTTSKQGYSRLVPVVSASRKAILVGCSLTKESYETLSSVLQSLNSPLKELDISYNDLQDSGVEPLSAGLKSSHCQLEKMRLGSCNLKTKDCKRLGSALKSENSSLKELDLSNNDLQDSGVELLSAGLKSSHCKLQVLRLVACSLTKDSCKTLCSALQSTDSSLKELDLSNNDLQNSGVELLSDGLKSSHCKLQILRLALCNLGEKCCEYLASALQSKNSMLKELELSNNDLQDSGIKTLSAGLMISHCKLEILRLSGCMVTDEGCSSLASVLRSNSSYIRQLDLTYNHLDSESIGKLRDHKLENLQVENQKIVRREPGLKKYAFNFTLDPNTAHTGLALSEKNRKVKRLRNPQPGEEPEDPDHPDRFEYCRQVLSTKGQTGRCYWEAKWKGKEVVIAMSYRGIGRKERFSDDCLFGYNNQSWSIFCFNDRFLVKHNNLQTVIPAPRLPSNRVGVYLDYEAGTLSFYSVSPDTQTQVYLQELGSTEYFPQTLTHLYTIHSTFTEPLYAGFRVYFGSVQLCDLNTPTLESFRKT
ncbi:NACHT, LRR and PYD domains-containing protein 3 isoform X4 [Astyanax mexicanus]|uniref:NACHT, LRR and PYD domains-containing protein 3 isoform X4 n=1 Tax=Astyanax mexicanus TaxID=7994 RepID=UPI0020CACE15|nr:NACHT, LRR and PYD domains-containing protein 3 isoform X4 [Astyanax mexicanus]